MAATTVKTDAKSHKLAVSILALINTLHHRLPQGGRASTAEVLAGRGRIQPRV